MQKSKLLTHCSAVVLAASLSSALFAQESVLPNSPSPAEHLNQRASADGSVSRSDRVFLEKAAKSGMKEVAVSQAVAGRLAHSEVNSFAQMMVSDHTGANSELMALAASKGVTLPPDDMKVTEKWTNKTKDLDDEYLDEMEGDHKEAVKLFEKATKADDAAIAAFAQKTLPTLQHHLMQVQALKKSVK